MNRSEPSRYLSNENTIVEEEINPEFRLSTEKANEFLSMKLLEFAQSLDAIHEKCRYVLKYKEDATQEEKELASKITETVISSGVFEYYR